MAPRQSLQRSAHLQKSCKTEDLQRQKNLYYIIREAFGLIIKLSECGQGVSSKGTLCFLWQHLLSGDRPRLFIAGR